MTNLEKYEALVELLMQAELAARNYEWQTCGTYARQAMELAYYNDTNKRKWKYDPELDYRVNVG